jgi:16S rRNA (cytosine967-C5)-methyltransferase
MADKVREKALTILHSVYEGAYSNIELNRELDPTEFKVLDRAFITELVYGTIKWTITLDHVIKNFSKLKGNKIAPRIRTIIRMGLYQIFFMDKVPHSAACNESVKLAGRYGHEGTRKFVNGLLRNVIRETEGQIDKVNFPDKDKESAQFLSGRYGYPIWMVEKFLSRHDFNFVQDMLRCDIVSPDLTIRYNRIKTTRQDLMDSLNSKGLECVPGKYSEDALMLVKPSAISKIDEFNLGLFTVQGESSMLVARVLSPAHGEKVLDMCSAPGGKTTHIAELMGNKGEVIATDIFHHKVELVKKAAQRLGIEIIHAAEGDGTAFNKEFEGAFDRVLVDAPCSGLGIMRKKPEIKLVRNESDIKGLTQIQKAILNNASRYVKPGGTLVYSTCTILEEENLNVVNDFLGENKMFNLEGFDKLLPQELPGREEAEKGYLRLFSNMGMDGFFMAKLKRDR